MSRPPIDLYDLERYETAGIPHEQLAYLRAHDPVHWCEEPDGGRGFWAITRYEDVVRVSKDPKTFSSALGGTNIKDFPDEDLSLIRMMMVNMDPPQHVKFRRLVRTGFTPRMVSRLEESLDGLVANILDGVTEKGGCDFVPTVAAELPLQVIAEFLGVPYEERQRIFDLSNRLIGFDDPEFQSSHQDMQLAAMEMWQYAASLGEQRTGGDGDDLVSVLMRAEIDGERLTPEEFNGFFLLLSVAGNETTRNAISGGLLTLLEHPDQLEMLKNDRSLMPTAVDEMLRWVTPIIHFRRTAVRDVEMCGRKITEGDKVVMFYPSANRDGAKFPDADVFDITRTPNDHLSFGIGEHFCLGASLARAEMRCMFDAILNRMPDIRLEGPVRRLRSNFVNGIKEMPVRYTASAKVC